MRDCKCLKTEPEYYFIWVNNSTMVSSTSEQLVYYTFITFQTEKQNNNNTRVCSFQMYEVNEQNAVNNNGIVYLQYGTNQNYFD